MKDARSPNEPRLLSSSQANSTRQSVAIFVCSLLEPHSILEVQEREFFPPFPHQPLIAPAGFFCFFFLQLYLNIFKLSASLKLNYWQASLMNKSSFYVLTLQKISVWNFPFFIYNTEMFEEMVTLY